MLLSMDAQLNLVNYFYKKKLLYYSIIKSNYYRLRFIGILLIIQSYVKIVSFILRNYQNAHIKFAILIIFAKNKQTKNTNIITTVLLTEQISPFFACLPFFQCCSQIDAVIDLKLITFVRPINTDKYSKQANETLKDSFYSLCTKIIWTSRFYQPRVFLPFISISSL